MTRRHAYLCTLLVLTALAQTVLAGASEGLDPTTVAGAGAGERGRM